MQKFTNRADAGAALGMQLALELPAANYTVLGLVRGGVAIAAEVATCLHAGLGALPVGKLRVPQNPELAIGAMAGYRSSTAEYYNEDVYRRADLLYGAEKLQRLEIDTGLEVSVKTRRCRDFMPEIRGKHVIICDDGLATGATAVAGTLAVREENPASILLAVPVGAADSINKVAQFVDDIRVLYTPAHFMAVGAFYDHFDQLSFEDVFRLLGAGE